MIQSVQFKNFKALRNTALPLSQFTLIVGPNGSGKSTALAGISTLAEPTRGNFHQLLSAGLPLSDHVTIEANWPEAGRAYKVIVHWDSHRSPGREVVAVNGAEPGLMRKFEPLLSGIRSYAFDANAIAQEVQLAPNAEIQPDGSHLAVVLDRLRDLHPEHFEAVNNELHRWLPEFNRILFDTPNIGARRVALRTTEGGYKISAQNLSQGTLVSLALLTLAYLPQPPKVVCLEEPDHGLHPRLLRDVRDAIYRLAYPEGAGKTREPVQVIATTHNPYFLDLFREHPEEIVIAEKVGLEAKFSRLSDRTDLNEILGDAHLGDVWYSGVLGGVPAGT